MDGCQSGWFVSVNRIEEWNELYLTRDHFVHSSRSIHLPSINIEYSMLPTLVNQNSSIITTWFTLKHILWSVMTSNAESSLESSALERLTRECNPGVLIDIQYLYIKSTWIMNQSRSNDKVVIVDILCETSEENQSMSTCSINWHCSVMSWEWMWSGLHARVLRSRCRLWLAIKYTLSLHKIAVNG